MPAGIAWALININSLPMVVDMTTAARLARYWSVLSLLHFRCDCGSKFKWVAGTVKWQSLQHYYADQPVIFGRRPNIDARCQTRRSTNDISGSCRLRTKLMCFLAIVLLSIPACTQSPDCFPQGYILCSIGNGYKKV